MKIQILSRFTGAVLFEHEAENNTIKLTMLAALEIRADLRGANLIGADLRGANLRWANLRVADLSEADLSEADLRVADLSEADLRGADLSEADLRGADLRGANLRWANLREADLSEADLRVADLSEADLSGANLRWANLRGADIDGDKITNNPIVITGLQWWILITDNYLRIGCQRHSHAKWAEMSNDDINAMDSSALDFWKQWRDSLLAMCKAHKGKGEK